MPSRLKQVLPHGVMFLAALWLYWASTRIEVDTGGRISPGAWPKAIIVIMALLCAYEIVKRLASAQAQSATGLLSGLTEKPSDESADAAAPVHTAKLMAGIALVAAYVVLVPWLGFFVATAIFLAVFPWVGGFRRPVMLAALAVAGSFALIVIFMRVAYISLPLGEGPFRALSLALLRLLGVT